MERWTAVQLILQMSDARDADAVCYFAYIVNLSNQSRKDIDWIYQITEHNITQRKQMNVSRVCVWKWKRNKWPNERTDDRVSQQMCE